MAVKTVIIPSLTEKDLERFWIKVDKNGPVPIHMPKLGNCWLWLGAKNKNGYGKFWIQGGHYMSHRVGYFIHFKEQPSPGLFVLHACDNPQCLRGDHLQRGSQAENMWDAKNKGRVRHGDNHPSRFHPEVIPRGANHHNVKYTAELVTKLREEYKEGGISIVTLGNKYRISDKVMHKILFGKLWKHVPGALTREEFPFDAHAPRGSRGPYRKKLPVTTNNNGELVTNN